MYVPSTSIEGILPMGERARLSFFLSWRRLYLFEIEPLFDDERLREAVVVAHAQAVQLNHGPPLQGSVVLRTSEYTGGMA